MKLNILHQTTYTYDAPVDFGLQQLRLTPLATLHQHVTRWDIQIEGGTKETAFNDWLGNQVNLASFGPDIAEITIRAQGEVEIEDKGGIVGPHSGAAPLWLFQRPSPRTAETKRVAALVQEVGKGDTLDLMHALSAHVRRAVTYEIGSSRPDWTAEDALEAGKGVCQDHAHVFIACARAMGVPARYVSGYLCMDDRADQTATHAWAEAHIDGLGWVGFDPSNGISPDGRYVRIATGLDYDGAAPVRGSRIGSAQESLAVSLRIAQSGQNQ